MNEADFNAVVERHGNRVYGFIVHYLGGQNYADDVMQEVLIKLWKKRDALDRERVLSWLLTVARNACIDEHRKNRNRQTRMTTNSDLTEVAPDDRQSSVSTAAEQQLAMEDLQREVEKLEDPYKSIVILREIQGFKYGEIADTLGLPLSTVKVYLHRARKKLREQLTHRLELNHAG
ncbi:MAG: RNA polymerase sigma factor [Rhodothermales bacterium]|nr:RNA polymerase sigma factor [Rhodothermales bacterium]